MEVTQIIEPLIGQRIGYGLWGSLGVGGQCGELASYWLTKLTNGKYQFGTGIPAEQYVPGSDCKTAWNVYTQTDWDSMGFMYINNPSLDQLKPGDIFFISPRGDLTTGHVGIVASISGGVVTTYEQNFGGAMYVRKIPQGNSWYYYGGFSGIVRPKEPDHSQAGEGSGRMVEMYLINCIDTKRFYVSNGVDVRYVRTIRELENYQNKWGKLNLPLDKKYQSELDREFGRKATAYNRFDNMF